uniref:Uncharacterized protein n=1 Tax=Rhizophora mucronata TaxID=61149 RepID=A0A2P2QML3_RHIMU
MRFSFFQYVAFSVN